MRMLSRGIPREAVVRQAESRGYDETFVEDLLIFKAQEDHQKQGSRFDTSLVSSENLTDSQVSSEFRCLISRTSSLAYRMPTLTNKVEVLCGDEMMRKRAIVVHARATYPLVHGTTISLMENFIDIKRRLGSPIERALYKDMDVEQLVDRLITKRPLAFLGACDTFMQKTGENGATGFDSVGKADEKEPLVLGKLMSYDEMQIASLMAVSTPTHFINSGGRSNCSRVQKYGEYENMGIYVAQVGARYERARRMEYELSVVTRGQNRVENGYGNAGILEGSLSAMEQKERLRLWAEYYGLSCLPTYEDAVSSNSSGETRFLPLAGHLEGGFLDLHVYSRRMRIAADMFLAEANARAEASRPRSVGGKGGAFCHVVGLGLGVWQVHGAQGRVVVESYAQALESGFYPHVSDLSFSWFPEDCVDCGGVPDGGEFKTESGIGVLIHFNRRDPADVLIGVNAGKLLVAQYAWDGNSFPGNEYWLGSLSASGDPAAACCSTIPELQNPDVNLALSSVNVRVVVDSKLSHLQKPVQEALIMKINPDSGDEDAAASSGAP